MPIKHVGRMVKSKKKVIVAYRVIPGEPDHCLVIPTESLDASSHDSIINVVESNAGQTAYEFAEAMHRAQLPDGLNMLVGMHKYGKFQKMPTANIEMTPDTQTVINLAELNKIIADQKGVTVADLALKGPNGETVQPTQTSVTTDPAGDYIEPTVDTGVITDEQLAAQYRSQADAMFKEAKRLREQAEELAPTKKKRTKASAEVE